MCLEDLRLGRGRFFKPPIVSASTGPATMDADSSRVAVVVSAHLIRTWDSTGGLFFNDRGNIRSGASTGDPIVLNLDPGLMPLVLRVEDLGSIVTGPLTFVINNETGQALITAIAICTEVNAPPLDTYKP